LVNVGENINSTNSLGATSAGGQLILIRFDLRMIRVICGHSSDCVRKTDKDIVNLA